MLSMLLEACPKHSSVDTALKPLDAVTVRKIYDFVSSHRNDYDKKFVDDILSITKDAAQFYSYCAPFLCEKLWKTSSYNNLGSS